MHEIVPGSLHDLPVTHVLPDLCAALQKERTALLQAPPGAGKTTLVPIALLNQEWLKEKKVLMLEPRRLAARGAAWRIAELLNDRVSGIVGYRMRGETNVSRDTRIEVVTEGILTRMLQSDPSLQEYGVIIFDEFHERSLHADLGLALVLQARELFCPDLRLLIMSATLEVEPMIRLLGDIPVIKSEGRVFPVETRYVGRDEGRRIEDEMAGTIARALREVGEGDLLAFLPGYGEISRTAAKLNALEEADVYPLYSGLSRSEQDRAIYPLPNKRRKVVLATSIAETSLTIEGVRVVIDSGLSRVPRFNPGAGMTRLETVRVSRASADQRRGRAGRLGSGVCYRLWSEREDSMLLPASTPEIMETDLVPLALDLLRWGALPDELRWIDRPPTGAYAAALDLLRSLEAVDDKDHLTAMGEHMATLPLHPRLGRMVIQGAAFGAMEEAIRLAALLEERDLFRSSHPRQEPDLRLRLDLIKRFQQQGYNNLPADVDGSTAKRILQSTQKLSSLVSPLPLGEEIHSSERIGEGSLLALAYPDRIAQRREESSTRYILRNGQSTRLLDVNSLSNEEYLVVLSLGGRGTERIIEMAIPITLEELQVLFSKQIESRRRVEWMGADTGVVVYREERLGALTLSSFRVSKPDNSVIIDATLQALRDEGLQLLKWTKELLALRDRITFLHHYYDAGWPDMSDAGLIEQLDGWMLPALQSGGGRNRLKSLNLRSALLSLLNWEQQRDLELLAPERIEVASGSHIRIDYSNPDGPILPVRLQEMFGATDTPTIGKGKVPLTLHLLSPAQRPVQVTQDLAGFWERTYAEVKKELKGRYPKHYWPDDPLQAEATRKTKRATSR